MLIGSIKLECYGKNKIESDGKKMKGAHMYVIYREKVRRRGEPQYIIV